MKIPMMAGLCLLLAAVMPAQAQFSYTIKNNSATITGYTGPGGGVTVPDTLGGVPVVAIADESFGNNPTITDVYFPASVTNISSEAFTNCAGLTAFLVDPNNQYFSSFNGVLYTKSLATLLQFPEALAGDYAIPTGVTSILPSAFANCIGPVNLEIPGSITNVASKTFFVCSGLAGVVLDNGVKSVGQEAFFACFSLTNLVIPDSLNDIGSEGFAFSGLAGLSFSGIVTNLGSRAFENCYNLATVTFSKGLTNIGDLAFADCANLVSVIVSGAIPSVGYNIFLNDPLVSVFYLPGSTGTTNYFGGFLPLPWNPVIQTGDGSFGLQGNNFGFNITGSSNLVVVVQGATNLFNAVWQPVQTLTLTNGTGYFGVPVNASIPIAFFRLTTP